MKRLEIDVEREKVARILRAILGAETQCRKAREALAELLAHRAEEEGKIETESANPE